jgi:chitodextrinase
LAEPTGTSYADTAVVAGTSYSYQVRAVDAAGNASGLSNTAAINTPPPPDTVAPSAPGGLTARATSPTRVELSWTSSTDNVRVTKYRVFRNGSASALAELAGTSYADTSVVARTAYSYQVSAVDAAGNTSALSNKVTLTTPANSSPSGEPMPVGDLAGWRLIFSDDFTTDVPLGSFPAAVSSKWSAYLDGWKDTSRRGTYMPSKVVSIHDGLMDMHLHTEGGVHMVAAPVPELPGIANGQLYGRYAVRFKADPVACHKTAWLLWPDSEVWPRDGEVDFPEGSLDGNMNAFMHRQNGTSGGDQDAFSTSAKYTSWHTAVIEWSPGLITFILDGAVIGTSTSRVPNTPMHWVIQTETSLDCEPTEAMSGHVLIDWVAVYSR